MKNTRRADANAGPPGSADATQSIDRSTADLAAHAGGDVHNTGPEVDIGFLQTSRRTDSLGRLGHFEVIEVIGKGGFGIVLKAFDEKLHRVVAVKVLAPELAANGSARKRFIREVRMAATVKNDHIVGIYEVDDEAQPPYLAMEMIDGLSLQDQIDRCGPLALNEVLRMGLQIAEGLSAAHKQGLVHRDIKPANILLENSGERVKITDFGLARAVDDASVTQSGAVAGTPMYMSPEQAEGLPIDHRSDLFSLGTVLYAMCTGHSPFRAGGTHAVLKRVIEAAPRPIREINHEIPDWLCEIVGKLHAKRPEDRIQTANEVAMLLAERFADVQAERFADQQAGRPTAGAGIALAANDGAQRRGSTDASAPAADATESNARRSHRRFVWAALAGAVVVALWCAPGTVRYVANRAAIEFAPQTGMLDVIVLQNDVSVTDWMDIRQGSLAISLPAGRYRINGSTTPGYEMTGWEIATSHLFVGVTRKQPGTGCDVELHRGDRVVIRPLARRLPGGS